MADEKTSTVELVMNTGKEYKFTMPSDKVMMFAQHIEACKLSSNKCWIDVWDYTDAVSGQFMINMHAVESLHVEPVVDNARDQQPETVQV